MYRKIRITVAALAVVMISIASSSMTLSYFTDTDAETNNFKIGNVSTELTIYGNESGTKKLADMIDDGEVLAESSGHIVDHARVPFYLSAENTGNITVYQRFRVVIPKALADKVTLKSGDCDLSSSSCSSDKYEVTYDVNDQYAEYYLVSKNALGASKTTAKWPTTELYFDGITDEDKDQFDNCGTNNNGCILGIKAYSDAIQTTGFTSATNAFEDFGETY